MAKTNVLTKPPTLKQVASEAGVSYSTAGLVLNGRGDKLGIRQETQQAILDAARRLGYSPSRLARGLLGKRTRSIGILWSGGSPDLITPISRQFARNAIKHGYSSSMVESFSDLQVVRAALRQFQQQSIDGVIVQLSVQADNAWQDILEDKILGALLESFHGAAVVVNRALPLAVDQVIQTMDQGYQQAISYLVQQGQMRPVFIGDLDSNPSKIIHIRQALAQHGLDEHVLHLIDFPKPHLSRANPGLSRQMLDLAKQVRASGCNVVFCANDAMAVPLVHGLQETGLHIPRDIRIIGHDNLSMTEYLKPGLATVDRRYSQVIEAACKILFDRLESANPKPPQTMTISSEFVLRASAGLETPCLNRHSGQV